MARRISNAFVFIFEIIRRHKQYVHFNAAHAMHFVTISNAFLLHFYLIMYELRKTGGRVILLAKTIMDRKQSGITL